MAKILPHHPQDTEHSAERIMLHNKIAERIYVSGNDKVSPDKLVQWIESFNAEGWSNLRIDIVSWEQDYIVIRGDRLETDSEYKDRQERIINNWQREYEEFLSNKHFYEDTPTGKARIEEIDKKKKRPINYP